MLCWVCGRWVIVLLLLTLLLYLWCVDFFTSSYTPFPGAISKLNVWKHLNWAEWRIAILPTHWTSQIATDCIALSTETLIIAADRAIFAGNFCIGFAAFADDSTLLLHPNQLVDSRKSLLKSMVYSGFIKITIDMCEGCFWGLRTPRSGQLSEYQERHCATMLEYYFMFQHLCYTKMIIILIEICIFACNLDKNIFAISLVM